MMDQRGRKHEAASVIEYNCDFSNTECIRWLELEQRRRILTFC